jgi:hypothetical protein
MMTNFYITESHINISSFNVEPATSSSAALPVIAPQGEKKIKAFDESLVR